MESLSFAGLIKRRFLNDWKLLLSVFTGIAIATTLVAGTPVYLDSLEQLGFIASLDQVSSPVLVIDVSGPNIVLTGRSLQQTEQAVANAIDRHLSGIYLTHDSFLMGGMSLVGFPERPLPTGGGRGVVASRGYLQSLSDLESHSRFIEGRMASDSLSDGLYGPDVEAIVSAQTARAFNAGIGDVFTLTPSLEASSVISAVIVGILEPADSDDEYWESAAVLLDPPPLAQDPPLLVQVDPDEPPLALFVTENVMLQVLGDLVSIRPLGRERHLTGAISLAGLPGRPLPLGGGTGVLSSLGYFMSISNLEAHSRVLEGSMAGNSVSSGPNGPVLEAVVAGTTETRIGINVGDVLTLSPTLGSVEVISARIMGIVEPADPDEPYWASAGGFLISAPVSRGAGTSFEGEVSFGRDGAARPATRGAPLLVQPDPIEPPIALLVTREAMVEGMGRTYPGSLAEPFWAIQVDKERLKGWTVSQTRARLKGFEDEILRSIPGALVNSGITRGVTEAGQRKTFLSKVPLLLLLAVMVVTALLFLMMMVSYLVQSREGEAALLRTRGVETRQFIQLYLLEGLAIAALAVAIAPFLAMGAIAIAGVLPFFSEITNGAMLPVRLSVAPFLLALAAGLLCLAIYVIPGALGLRGGQVMLALRSSRPPSMPWVHRYNLDFALVVLGGLTFWELYQRGHIVAGGLLKEAEVNEALLLAPVLFLMAVALVFMRLFPLIMRFVSGESLALVDLLVTVSVLALASGIGAREVREGDSIAWLGSVAVLLLVAGAYWATHRVHRLSLRAVGVTVQAALVGGFLVLEQPAPELVLFVPIIALVSIVPAQFVFPLLRGAVRSAPAWLSVGLWQMARNPMQYAWLVLLLVLVTGLGVLSTTVGGTLERSERERVLYELPVDLRVRGLGMMLRGPERVKEDFLEISGVTYASPALRTSARARTVSAEFLALESKKFPDISWYREDFSALPFEEVMGLLRPDDRFRGLQIPEGAASIGLWVRPVEVSRFMVLFVVIGHGDGTLETVFLGDLGLPGWRLLRAEIPTDLEPPLYLVSVEVFEPTIGQGSPGQILLDDIHVTLGPFNEERVLEDFEGETRWTPIATLALPTDTISLATGDVHGGDKAGVFSFGNQTDRGMRGFYYNPTGRPLPVVVSSSLAASTGLGLGEAFTARIADRWVPLVIEGTIDYFPTVSPLGGGFILADLGNLLSHLNVLLEPYSVRPNELFVESDEASHAAVKEALTTLVGRDGLVQDAAARLELLRLDPFISAGWKPMQFLAPAIGGLAAAVGYVTYLLLFAKRSWNEMGSMRVIGLSRLQLRGLLAFQHLSMAAIGAGLGTWSGSYMSRLLVSPLAVTETGQRLVPPFIITTDWVAMLANYAVLLVVFLAALHVLNRAIARMELHTLGGFGDV